MGTKNSPGQFDCYAKAEPDEPMFVLLGRDKHAPTLVWLWAALRELDGERADVVSEARDCMSAMLIWQHDRGRSAAGLGQAALVGVLELIRAANARAGQTMNDAGATSVDVLRAWLSSTKFEGVGEHVSGGES